MASAEGSRAVKISIGFPALTIYPKCGRLLKIIAAPWAGTFSTNYAVAAVRSNMEIAVRIKSEDLSKVRWGKRVKIAI